MGSNRTVFLLLVVTSGAVAGVGLGLLAVSGTISPAGETADREYEEASDAFAAACRKHYQAKAALRKGQGSSEEEVDRLARELTAAHELQIQAMEKVRPYYEMSDYQYRTGLRFAQQCFIAAAVLAIIGGGGLLNTRRQKIRVPAEQSIHS